jgi:hypothetical protein
MTLLGVILVLAQATPTAASSPQPVASPALKEIYHTHSSAVCSALNNNLLPAVDGLRANDDLASHGQAALARIAQDAAASVEARQDGFIYTTSATLTGGASTGPEMDNYRLGNLVHAIARNLEKIEALLDDPKSFPSNPASANEQQLLLVRSLLGKVVAEQRASLNVLSGTQATNAANDLRSQRDTIPYEHDMSGPETPHYTFTSRPEALSNERQLTQQAEADVTPAVLPLVAACR